MALGAGRQSITARLLPVVVFFDAVDELIKRSARGVSDALGEAIAGGLTPLDSRDLSLAGVCGEAYCFLAHLKPLPVLSDDAVENRGGLKVLNSPAGSTDWAQSAVRFRMALLGWAGFCCRVSRPAGLSLSERMP